MKLYVVGLGPGSENQITPRALEALNDSDVIAGYSVYVDMIKTQFENKEFLVTQMKKEVQRCELAVLEALKGKTVSMVCSGDAGVYGMAGLICEIAEPYPDLEIEVVPGITAACAGASVLGAPLIHDFAVISLSDLLTPWELIEKRLNAAAEADFVISLYNPSSKKRYDYLQKACDIILKHRSKDNICGYVRNIGREGEVGYICTLEELRDIKVDMFTTVFIGNSNTKKLNGRMVTPRGYKIQGE